MANEFKCPACSAPMEFGGGDSIFQTCPKCHAPIVVPADVFYTKDKQIVSEDFATLANDKPVVAEQVSLDVGAGEVANDDKIEEIISSPDNDEFAPQTSQVDFSAENVAPTASQNIEQSEKKEPSDAQLSQLHYLLNQGRKIEAIRFYRGIYGSDLHIAKTEIEKMLEQKKSNKNMLPKNESTETIIARIENEIANGNKINAIKIFLDSFDAGLKESKEVVDAMESGRKVDISGFQRR